MCRMSSHPARPPSSPVVPRRSRSPWWARAAVGLIVGLIAGVFLSALIALIALGLTIVAPGLGAASIWRAAATVAGLTFIAGVAGCVWRSVRAEPDARADRDGHDLT